MAALLCREPDAGTRRLARMTGNRPHRGRLSEAAEAAVRELPEQIERVRHVIEEYRTFLDPHEDRRPANDEAALAPETRAHSQTSG